MKPKLTIGMASHNDYHGVFFTINALRMYQDIGDCELIVVDNDPNSESGKHTKAAVENCANGWAAVQYIPLSNVLGTSAPRDLIFHAATGEAVMCIDCHVLLAPNAIADLKAYYNSHPQTMDLLSGPMLFDQFIPGLYTTAIATHFTPRWRGEMEGTWGLAWRCTKCGNIIDVVDIPDQTTTMYRALMSEGPFKHEYQCNCGNIAPACGWGDHESPMIKAGWEPCGARATDVPFEIPGQGLGLFTCRKEAWLGFNPRFRGFGGEELYIHRKFKMKGHRNLCLPFLRWHHRFAPASWVTYNRERYSKVRNYVLGHLETNRDLEPVRQEFVVTPNRLPESEWAYLVKDPNNNVTAPTCGSCGSAQKKEISEGDVSTKDKNRFIELASQHKRIAILSKRDWFKDLMQAGKPDSIEFYAPDGTVPDIKECDLLVIHSMHHADYLMRELESMAPKVTGRILLRSTHAFGEMSEDGKGPGLLPAMRLYMRKHPEWRVMEHSHESWGYTILSRLDEDKPKLPGVITMAANLAKAAAAHIADGLGKTSLPILELRLNECSVCDYRVDDRCSVCGCYLAVKAAMSTGECPLGKWPMDTVPETETVPAS